MSGRPSRVVVVGATGLIGARLAAVLWQLGVPLLCVHSGRRAGGSADADAAGPPWLAADLRASPPASFWLEHLQAGDVVVNAAGVLREENAGELEAVQHTAPAALFDACAAAGAACVIQISALGARADAPTPFLATKGRADAHLLGLGVRGQVVRPSLVWARDGPSARLFGALAALPLAVLPDGGRQPVQPVHIDDVMAGLLALVMAPERAAGPVIDMVGPQPLKLAEYLRALRRAWGLRHGPWVISMPPGLFLRMAGLAGSLGSRLIDASSARMLLAGSAAPSADFAALLGRAPKPVAAFLAGEDPAATLREARLFWLLPLLRLSIALVWLWTAAVSAGLYPVDESLALLHAVGVGPGLAPLLLIGAVALDLLLGIGSLAAPVRWRVRIVWPMQLAVMAGYTAILSAHLPAFWLHPFGPLSKNLPMAAAAALLWAIDASRLRPSKPR